MLMKRSRTLELLICSYYSKIDKSMIIILGGRHYLWISSLDFIKDNQF